jgi:hypothetical protein
VEGALNVDALRLALGAGGLLPSAEDLRSQLAEAEIALFLGRGQVDDQLLATGWYLHAVGSARRALEIYPVDRQLRANQTAAHIFDLALASSDLREYERHELVFAGQVSYLRGDLDPNAAALYRRVEMPAPLLRTQPGLVSLEVGSSLLALDRARLFPRLETLRREAQQIRQVVGVADLLETPLGSAARVVEACRELLVHLTYGGTQRLDRARTLLDEAITAERSQSDLDSRWVAAHLRDIGDDLGSSSLWALLPPSVPPAAARAMTLGSPPVLSLWPPQLELLKMDPSPLDPAVRRLVLSFPTSAGKTLIAQLIAAAHIAANRGAVCVVVPTHSLAREVRLDLDRRLGILAREARDAGPLGLPLPEGPSVTVMTPEKLSAHLRTEPAALLARYSLFVVDEAHLVGDAERGWVLESALSFLNEATTDTDHRIVVLSAALGNRSHVAAWLGAGPTPATTFHHDWRGPRRAHAVLGTSADWDHARDDPPSGRRRLHRRYVPLYGQIHVRTGDGQHTALTTTEPIGELEQALRDGDWKREAATPSYRVRAHIAEFIGQHGPVLVIEATKPAAQRTAEAIADLLEDSTSSGALVALASTRVGEGHPLVKTLRKGVGFHHSGLSDDLQAELEDGLRRGTLGHLVATTTLIEGINFPVRSVLIGERGYRSADGPVTTLDAPKLLNAIGRAGRAGRETEGWVVLSIQEQFTHATFEPLLASDEDLEATSRIASPKGLDALAEFEELLRAGEDAVLESAGTAAADFVAHVWFVAAALDDLGGATADAARLSIETTLAWEQMSDEMRARWRAVADVAVQVYDSSDPQSRRRWARAGTSIASARRLDQLVVAIREEMSGAVIDRTDPVGAFELVMSGGRLDAILDLGESRFRGFKPARTAAAGVFLPVDLGELALDWLRGDQLEQLATRHLGNVPDETYRYEQLSEFVSQVLEHLLPWVLSTLLTWLNEPEEDESRLCPQLPAFVRYGVPSETALQLMLGGVRSRRLAQRVSSSFDDSPHEPEVLTDWLAEMTIPDWRQRFDAAPSELADLLAFTRATDAGVTSRALAGDVVELPITAGADVPDGPVELVHADELPPAAIVAVRNGEFVGALGPRHHDDVARLLTVGVPLIATVGPGPVLRIRVEGPEQFEAWTGDAVDVAEDNSDGE